MAIHNFYSRKHVHTISGAPPICRLEKPPHLAVNNTYNMPNRESHLTLTFFHHWKLFVRHSPDLCFKFSIFSLSGYACGMLYCTAKFSYTDTSSIQKYVTHGGLTPSKLRGLKSFLSFIMPFIAFASRSYRTFFMIWPDMIGGLLFLACYNILKCLLKSFVHLFRVAQGLCTLFYFFYQHHWTPEIYGALLLLTLFLLA